MGRGMIKPSEFEVRAVPEGDDATRLVVTGDLDIATVPELTAELDRALSNGPRRVLLDLRGLTFADSSGVRVLITITDQAREGGWELEIVRPPEEAFMVFRISGADVGLPFVDG